MTDRDQFFFVMMFALILSHVTHGWTSIMWSVGSSVFAALYFADVWLARKERKAKR